MHVKKILGFDLITSKILKETPEKSIKLIITLYLTDEWKVVHNQCTANTLKNIRRSLTQKN